ncbi:MAG: hypothetical protein JNM43_02700 [Planctomycetaceae bacterium]|nr:hypothetical protein [Planctomycetaceae bacterium]
MTHSSATRTGSMLLAEEYFESGDDRFVEELRAVTDAERLGAFASRWMNDPRSIARQFLRDYLSLPLNSPRHEALVKRLFKLAEKDQDDELMGQFLRAFDVSIRRRKRTRQIFNMVTRQYWTSETILAPQSGMPRHVARYTASHRKLRLFSVPTRRYLTRRSWRYFRQLGAKDPARYVEAVTRALLNYTDADTPDGLALIDNWGLMHILFHHTDVLTSKPSGWQLPMKESLANLTPTPAFPDAWKSAPNQLWLLVRKASARAVQQWALRLLNQDHKDFLNQQPIADFVALTSHKDDSLARFAAELLSRSTQLSSLTNEQWFLMLEQCNPAALETLCQVLSNELNPQSISLTQHITLACSRPESVAEIGLKWLRASSISSPNDYLELGRLARAECEALRPQLLEWLKSAFAPGKAEQALISQNGGGPAIIASTIMDLLDSRFPDVRQFAWAWFESTPAACQDVRIWQKLLESPYDDIRFGIVRMLEQQPAPDRLDASSRGQLSKELVRSLWATVLLNVRRGAKQKPIVLQQISDRIQEHPDEASQLLPLLAVALRSIRGTEWKKALALLVQLAEVPDLHQQVVQAFPDVGWNLVGGTR